MSVYGNSAPCIKLVQRDSNNALTIITSITCPTPQKHTHDYHEEIIAIKNYEGRILDYEIKYRFWTSLRFIQLTSQNYDYLAKIASWDEMILFYTSADSTAYVEEVKVVSFHPFHDDDKINYDGADIEFQGVSSRSRIISPDEMILCKERTGILT